MKTKKKPVKEEAWVVYWKGGIFWDSFQPKSRWHDTKIGKKQVANYYLRNYPALAVDDEMKLVPVKIVPLTSTKR